MKVSQISIARKGRSIKITTLILIDWKTLLDYSNLKINPILKAVAFQEIFLLNNKFLLTIHLQLYHNTSKITQIFHYRKICIIHHPNLNSKALTLEKGKDQNFKKQSQMTLSEICRILKVKQTCETLLILQPHLQVESNIKFLLEALMEKLFNAVQVESQ